MRRRTRVWLKGLTGGTLGGIATAITSWLSLALAGALGATVDQLSWKQFSVVMVAGGVASACAYLAKSPLPNPADDTRFHARPP